MKSLSGRGEETVVSDLLTTFEAALPITDKLVATTFGTMAYDAIQKQKHGLMAAIVGGDTQWPPFRIQAWASKKWT